MHAFKKLVVTVSGENDGVPYKNEIVIEGPFSLEYKQNFFYKEYGDPQDAMTMKLDLSKVYAKPAPDVESVVAGKPTTFDICGVNPDTYLKKEK